jgi:hypothetical protein
MSKEKEPASGAPACRVLWLVTRKRLFGTLKGLCANCGCLSRPAGGAIVQFTGETGAFYFRSQLLLLFRQVSEQPSHHQQIHRTHKQMFGLKLDHIDSQLGPVVAEEAASHQGKESLVYGNALQPKQNHGGSDSAYCLS